VIRDSEWQTEQRVCMRVCPSETEPPEEVAAVADGLPDPQDASNVPANTRRNRALTREIICLFINIFYLEN
jgi:hypothetical protein